MSRYEVVIKRIDPRRHGGFRYQITVYWNRVEGTGDTSWSYTRWGSHHEAKKLVKKHKQPKEVRAIVEDYTLEDRE